MIQQSLQNKLRTFDLDREVVTLVTQVRIDENDPAISNPTKFVGKTYSEETARSYADKLGWDIAEQNSGEWRRVVPSPLPYYVMHGKSIKALVDRGTIVSICVETEGWRITLHTPHSTPMTRLKN